MQNKEVCPETGLEACKCRACVCKVYQKGLESMIKYKETSITCPPTFSGTWTGKPLGLEAAAEKPSKEAVKHDDDKPPLDLLSYQAKVEIAKVFGFGAKKYGRYNYKKGMDWSKVIAAAERHLGAFNSGEDLDPESGLPHLGHLGCCVFMLLDYYFNNKDKDDRYKNAASKTE